MNSARSSPWLDQLVRYRMAIVLVMLLIAASVVTPKQIDADGTTSMFGVFATQANLVNVARQISFEGLIAFGMTLIIVTGGIDLSVGSVVALCGIMAGLALRAMPDATPLLGILAAAGAGIGAGTAVGTCNGLIVTRFNLPPFIVTLGAMLIARGFALIACNGEPIYEGFTPEFCALGRGFLWPDALGKILPIPVVVMVCGFILFHVLLSRTVFGRSVIAVGSNAEAARLSGIAVRRTRLLVYVLTGALCGIVGVLHNAKLNSADPKIGEMWELNVIAAVVVGGTSLFGGRGSIPGTLIGALIIGVLNNTLNLCHVPHFWQKVVLGSVILLAALLDSALSRLKR
jgi:ribose/xylose/arabinose/galactoside ABC-type transport system permease subunit